MSTPLLSPAQQNPDVLIVGAGPVGLTAAAELTRHGVRVRIVDKRDGPVIHSQALAVHVRTLEILRAMGIVDGWLKAGYLLEEIRLRAFGKKIGNVLPGGVDSPYPGPLAVSQQVTEQLLVEHLERLGITVERQVEATAFSQDAGGVNVTLRHLAEGDRITTAHAAWMVDCEGSASKAREAMGIPFDGDRYSGQEFLMADAQVRWSYPHGPAYGFVEKERTLLCLPFDGKGHCRVLCLQPDLNPERKELPTLEEIQTIAREMSDDPRLRLTDPRWVTRFRTQHRLAGRFREKRVFLAGDAGHVHVPIGGQGMNYGMADAFNLAWKLGAVIRGDARPEPFLDSYNAERHPVDTALLHGTDESFRAMSQPGRLKELAIRVIGPVALASETVQSRLRTMVSGIKVAYPESPVVEDRGGSDGPAAGERAPDAQVVSLAAQETISLFDLIYAGTRWTLLLFAGDDPTEETCGKLAQSAAAALGEFGHLVNAHFVLTDLAMAEIIEGGSVLMDREGTAHDKYGAKAACFYLVPPDGHIGFRGPAASAGHLLAYLFRIGLVSRAA